MAVPREIRHRLDFGGLIAMRYDPRDMTHGNLWKQILIFSLPLMASNLLQVLFNMSDIAVVGQFAGSHALGSVGSTATLAALYSGFLIGMGAGVNVLTARFIGARERENTRQTVHTASAVCLGLGVILFALCFCLARPLLTLLGTKEELIDGAILYMRIYAFGLPAMALYNFGSAVLTASGDTKRPLIFLSIAGGLNICLNLFFVIVCKMAADGVALATILSQYTSAVLVLRVLLRTQEDYRLELKNFVFSWEKAQRILALGITSGLQHAIFAMANLFIQSAVNTFSAAVVEGNSAAANADSLVYEVMAAPYTACSTFISQNYGAHNKERIQKAYRVSLVYSFGVGAVLGLALWALNRSTAAEEAASSAAADGTIPLCSFSTADLSRITYTYNGQTLTLDHADGSWTLAEDSDYHLDESACNTMVTALSSLHAKRQLDAQAGEDYGFDAPELTVTVTAAGQTTTLTLGSSNTVTGDRYVQKDGDTALYTVDASRTACFAYDKAGLFGSFSPAGFAASDVEQVAYTLASGEKVSLTAGSELAEDGDEADSASYETVWRFAGDADTDLDQDKVQSMLSALSSYVSGQITPADGADPAACGFDAPLAVVQVTTADGTKTLTYASGTDGYYLMVEGDDSIYAVDGSIVQAVTQTADALTAA